MVLGMWAESAILIFVYPSAMCSSPTPWTKPKGAIRSLIASMPKEALVRVDGREVMMATENIQVGDIVVIRPGERIPVDGKVAEGSSYVDEATVTGESVPVHKTLGEPVFAGTINQNGSLEVRVDKPASETMLSKIIMSVEEAQANKTSYQTFSDAFAKYYTPAMFVLGLLVATVPPLLFDAAWHPFILRGLVVFVVSCSCGLALSVPTTVVAAMANAAERHRLQGRRLSRGHRQGEGHRLRQDRHPDHRQARGHRCADVRRRLSRGPAAPRGGHRIVLGTSPRGRSRGRKATENGDLAAVSVEGFQEVSGLGVTATIDGRRYCLGNPRFQEESDVSVAEVQDAVTRLEDDAKTVVVVSENNRVIGLLGIADTVRPGVKDVIDRLKRTGIRTVMLTGDNERSARAIAHQLGIDEYYGGLLPTDKVDVLKDLREEHGSVAMVGDGINDAPAMAVANVGIAMGAAGSDVAVEAGDVVLMSDDLAKIAYLRELSARAVRTIRQNIWISLVNVAFMVSAALAGYLGLVSGLLLNEASALFVIFNVVWLLKWKSSAQAAPRDGCAGQARCVADRRNALAQRGGRDEDCGIQDRRNGLLVRKLDSGEESEEAAWRRELRLERLHQSVEGLVRPSGSDDGRMSRNR